MVRAEVDLPGSILALIKVNESQLCLHIAFSGGRVCREDIISLGKAAELAGARSKGKMLMLLSKRWVPLSYTQGCRRDLPAL